VIEEPGGLFQHRVSYMLDSREWPYLLNPGCSRMFDRDLPFWARTGVGKFLQIFPLAGNAHLLNYESN